MRQRKKSGFTLIELLVVIGIILLLASILTPALLKAREQANRTTCLSNIRSIGQAMHVYANEYEGQFPWAAGAGASPTSNEIFATLMNPKYFNNVKIFRCPSKPAQRLPTLTWAGAVATIATGAYTTGQFIPYCPVGTFDVGLGAERAPVNVDPGSNVLLIEDYLINNNPQNVYNNGDNHDADGGNVFFIGGSASFSKGAVLPINANSDGTFTAGKDNISSPMQTHAQG